MQTASKTVRVAVESSSVTSVGFDAGLSAMDVEFAGGAVYRYFAVPAAVHAALMELADATVEQLRGATRALRQPGAKAKEDPFARAIAQALNRGPLRTISVRVAADKVSLGAIPLGALPALAAALAKVQLPAAFAPK